MILFDVLLSNTGTEGNQFARRLMAVTYNSSLKIRINITANTEGNILINLFECERFPCSSYMGKGAQDRIPLSGLLDVMPQFLKAFAHFYRTKRLFWIEESRSFFGSQ